MLIYIFIFTEQMAGNLLAIERKPVPVSIIKLSQDVLNIS